MSATNSALAALSASLPAALFRRAASVVSLADAIARTWVLGDADAIQISRSISTRSSARLTSAS